MTTSGIEQPRYSSLIDPPGIRTLLVGSALGRVAGGMVPIGLVLLLEQATSSFAFAGTILGLYALAMVVAGPARSALAVRAGHRFALLTLAALSSAGLIGVVAGNLVTAPTYLLALSVTLSGASAPPFGALMRTTWSHRLPGFAVPRAFGLDSVIEESSFVVGPLLASAILAISGPTSTVVVTAALCALGGAIMAFAAETRTHASPTSLRKKEHGGWTIARRRTGLLLIFLGIGLAIGGLEVGVPAFAVEQGTPALAGALYAVAAVSSALAALLWSRWSTLDRAATATNYFGLFFAGGVALLAAANSVAISIPLLLIAGLAMGPAVMSAYLAADASAETLSAKTHAAVFASVACNAGAAVGASIAGIAAASQGAAAGFLTLGVIAATVVLVGAVTSRRQYVTTVPSLNDLTSTEQ